MHNLSFLVMWNSMVYTLQSVLISTSIAVIPNYYILWSQVFIFRLSVTEGAKLVGPKEENPTFPAASFRTASMICIFLQASKIIYVALLPLMLMKELEWYSAALNFLLLLVGRSHNRAIKMLMMSFCSWYF